MKNRTRISLTTLPFDYSALVAFHAPRPIRDKADYENTVEIIDALAGHKLTRDQDDYLQILSQMVETYEAETRPSPKATSGIEALTFLMDQNDLGAEDLATLLELDRSTVFKILRGKRRLTLEHVRKLAARFQVSADLFVG